MIDCVHCGKPESDSKHIRYGADLDNPVKHQFEQVTDNTDLLTRAEAEAVNISVPDPARKVIAELMAALRERERNDEYICSLEHQIRNLQQACILEQDRPIPGWVNERIIELEQQLKEQTDELAECRGKPHSSRMREQSHRSQIVELMKAIGEQSD